MAQPGARAKVLVICPWVIKLWGLPAVVRVDFEASLRAAVMHQRFDIAFYADTPGLSLAQAEAVIRAHTPKLELIAVDAPEQIGPRLAKVLASRRS
jgi:hypothetical protein